jgi:hypothetical protein
MTPACRRTPIAVLAQGLVLWLALIAAPAGAHHSLASYDDDRVIEIDGTLKQAKVANPHTWFWVNVPAAGDAGATQWAIETAGTAFILRSIGGKLHDQFAPGQKVSVSFHPARNGGRTGLLVRMRFEDGRVLDGVPVK